jgi:hypothetical protein
MPLSGRDIYEAIKEQGVPAGTALSLLAFFGSGLQTYEQKQPKPKPLSRLQSVRQQMARERRKQLGPR